MAHANKKTPKQYRKELKLVTEGRIVALCDYIGARTKIKHRCRVCKWEWECIPGNLLQGLTKCPGCSGRKRLNHDQYVEELRSRKIEVLSPYKGRAIKTPHRCMACKYEWSATPDSITSMGSGCPACAVETRNRAGFKGMEVVLNERTYRLQGFEAHAIRYMESKGANLKKLAVDVADGKPTVKYRHGGRQRLYIPDFYYAPKHRIVEVKSIWTLLGEYEGNDMWSKNKRKARACLRLGYDFRMLVFDANGDLMRLPDNWMSLSKDQARARLS